jgi:RNA polymerase sigma-70 factor (ECF subfamily)
MILLQENQDLLHAFRAGDQRILELIYEQLHSLVRRFIRRRVIGCGRLVNGAAMEDVEDLVQEVFLKAFVPRARSAYDGVRPFTGYVMGIAHNTLVSWAQRRTREITIDAPQIELRLLPSSGEPSEEAARQAAVDRAVATLPPSLKAVHQQRFVLGRSQRAAAQALGIGRQVLRRLENDLRAQIRRELDDPGPASCRAGPPGRPLKG